MSLAACVEVKGNLNYKYKDKIIHRHISVLKAFENISASFVTLG